MTEAEFCRHYFNTIVDTRICTEVYRYLCDLISPSALMPSPDDNLLQVYGVNKLGGVAIFEVVDDLSIVCNVTRPEYGVPLDYIETVEDLLLYLARNSIARHSDHS
jgi:hypothetical protein